VIRHVRPKHNNRIANAFRLGAQSLEHKDSYLGARYRYLTAKLGKPKAIKAMARASRQRPAIPSSLTLKFPESGAKDLLFSCTLGNIWDADHVLRERSERSAFFLVPRCC
jgi:hypothetical protein